MWKFARRVEASTSFAMLVRLPRLVLRLALLGLLFLTLWQVKAAVQRRVGVQQLGPVDVERLVSEREDLDDQLDEPVLFAHVSDLHISRFRDAQRAPHLREWCDFMAEQGVLLRAVLVTGDLVDAKSQDQTGSQQYEEEWRTYAEVRAHCRQVLAKDGFEWIDTRGNHDVFDVKDNSAEHNPFDKYVPDRPSGSSLSNLTIHGNRYHVVMIDATPIPGQRRPFNFFGHLDSSELKRLQRWLNNLDEDARRRTIVAGHYPTSTYVDPEAIRGLLGKSIYMCGHLHTGLSAKKRMYARHLNGLLELELGDWKTHRRFRLMAFDKKSTLAISDHSFKELDQAVIMITHPRDVRTVLDHNDYMAGIRDEVRLMVFSKHDVTRVEISFDGRNNYVVSRKVVTESGLVIYKAPLPVQDMRTGLHVIQVVAHLSGGTTVSHSQSFSLDGSQIEFASISTFILTNNWLQLSEIGFYSMGVFAILLLVGLRLIHTIKASSQSPKMRVSDVEPWLRRFLKLALRKWWLLASVDTVFYASVMFVLWIMFLPWSVSAVFSDGYAVIFAWGILFLDPLYLSNPDLTYVYGIFSLIFFFIFQLLPVAKASEKSFLNVKKLLERSEDSDSETRLNPDQEVDDETVATMDMCKAFVGSHLLFSIGMILQSLHFVSIAKVYGITSALGPWGLGRMIFSYWHYKTAIGLGSSFGSEVMQVW